MSGKFGDWQKPANEEFYPMEDAGQIKLVKIPEGAKVIPTKMVYTTKGNGNLMTEYGMTSAAVVNKTTLNIFLTDAAIEDDDLLAFDVSKAFCEARRPKGQEIHVEVPNDYVNREGINTKGMCFIVYVYLYGSPDAMYQWCKNITTYLEMGIRCSFIATTMENKRRSHYMSTMD
ncbi:hypothetical protein HK100_010843 [Physocladia obscura]|uniref:Uncharacterized protein n=1 Tax=Physocladia obscura TaxID=109957 RepID=A0AAD5X970_9FUNG|nr:hypothetical protein HK100_010843 [Physocladia obscura]